MRTVAVSVAASAALVAAYLAFGGASYAPAKVADPCATRQVRRAEGFQDVAQRIVLSALDGAACELGVSREELVLAFRSRDSLQRFTREQQIGSAEFERLVRSGLLRAVADAERAGALSSNTADLLRSIARQIPLARLLDVLDLLPG